MEGRRGKLVRQFATSSSPSPPLLPSSTRDGGGSKRGATLVRGSSTSLVELPTFLDPWPVEVAKASVPKIGSHRLPRLALTNMGLRIKISSHPPNANNHIQNQEPVYSSLKDRLRDYQLPGGDKKEARSRRSQWTVMCVAIAFFATCLILVGAMLSITSEYQDQALSLLMVNMSRLEERRAQS